MHIDGIHYNPDCSCKSCKMVTNNKRDMKTPEVKENNHVCPQDESGLCDDCPCHKEEVKENTGYFRWKDTKEKVKGKVLAKDYDNWLAINAPNLEMWTGKEWVSILPEPIEEK